MNKGPVLFEQAISSLEKRRVCLGLMGILSSGSAARGWLNTVDNLRTKEHVIRRLRRHDDLASGIFVLKPLRFEKTAISGLLHRGEDQVLCQKLVRKHQVISASRWVHLSVGFRVYIHRVLGLGFKAYSSTARTATPISMAGLPVASVVIMNLGFEATREKNACHFITFRNGSKQKVLKYITPGPRNEFTEDGLSLVAEILSFTRRVKFQLFEEIPSQIPKCKVPKP